MASLQDTKCCVCNEPATHMVQDVAEFTDDIYLHFEPTGKVRGGCDDHPQESMTYRLSPSWGVVGL